MKKVVQKLIDWRDAWGNAAPFNPDLPGCRPFTFGDFFSLAARAVVESGGTFNEEYQTLTFPASITGGRDVMLWKDEIFKKIWHGRLWYSDSPALP